MLPREGKFVGTSVVPKDKKDVGRMEHLLREHQILSGMWGASNCEETSEVSDLGSPRSEIRNHKLRISHTRFHTSLPLIP